MSHAIGIDLGTTHSVVAYLNSDGRTEILPDREGNSLVPTIVMFGDNHTYVGEEARLRGRKRPGRLAACVKREMGLPYYGQVIEGEHFPPEVMQACILNYLRQEIVRQQGEDTSVVIAVPAFFNDLQRHATTVAGELAGLNVVGLLNEPVAALLAMREQVDFLNWKSNGEHQYFLVYDLGGYSFEATLLEVRDGSFTTLATERDSGLGGHHWDLRLIDHMAELFIRQHGIDPRDDPNSLADLLHRATKAKVGLCDEDQVSLHIKHGGKQTSATLSREEFAHLGSDLVERTVDMCQRVMTSKGLQWSDVPRVLLVGGATRMPIIRNALLEKTKCEPLCLVDPQEAVARGAAIYAAKHLSESKGKSASMDFRVCNVSSHSLGIEGLNPKNGSKLNKILIPRGTPLPATVTKDFVTKSSAQKKITIVVLEGEDSDPAKCTTVGRAVLTNLPDDLSEDWPIEVTYAYDASGKLSVDARVRYTDRAVHLDVKRASGMDPIRREHWRQAVTSGKGMAAMRKALADDDTDRHNRPIPVSKSDDDEEHAGVLSFLRRHVPFLFGRNDSIDGVERETGQTQQTGQ